MLPLADDKRRFSAVRVDPGLANDLSKYDIKEVSGGTEQTLFIQLPGWILPAAIFVGIRVFVIRRFTAKDGMIGGLMSIVRAAGLRRLATSSARGRCDRLRHGRVLELQKTVAQYHKLRVADLVSKRRTRSIVRPRQIAMSLAKEATSRSLPEIGDAFEGRDHTTVLHACRPHSGPTGIVSTLTA